MYRKLTVRNMIRSANNYIIYFITITLIVAFMYSFLALGYSQDILAMSENMITLKAGVFGISVLAALLSSFIVSYAIRFMLSQRKMEFGTYKLLGMEIKNIQRIFFIENGLIGVFAFSIGILLGIGLSGVFTQIVNNIFGIQHDYQVLFSLKAVFISFLFFLLMYSIGILRADRIIRHQKIVDMLYDSHKNEVIRKSNPIISFLVVILSLILLSFGIIFIGKAIKIQTNMFFLYFGAGMLLLFSGIYGGYYNVPYLFLLFFKCNVHRAYAEENLFLLGQINCRICSARRLMGIMAILLTISLCTMFSGLAVGAGYKANIEVYYPYDVGIAIDAPFTKESVSPILPFVNERCHIQDSVVYYLHQIEEYPIEVLALSDYNHLRLMLDLPIVSIFSNQYIIHCDTWEYMDQIYKELKQHPNIAIAGEQLYPCDNAVYTEPIEQYQIAGSNGYALIVPDSVAAKLSGNKIRLVMKLENGGYPELKNELRHFINETDWNPKLQNGKALPEKTVIGISVKAWGKVNSLMGYTVISFCALYLSFVFLILSCTVLAFQQLSAIDKNQYHYQVIDKMGVSRIRQGRLIFKELSVFFLIPLILPLVVGSIFIIGAQILFNTAIFQEGLIPIYGFIAIVSFLGIYLSYFSAAFITYRRIVTRNLYKD